VANPTTNSSDFATSIGVLGGSITTLTFDAEAPGAFNDNFYAGSGVTFSRTGDITTLVNDAGPAQLNTVTPPLSSGEGPHAASPYLLDPNEAAGTFTVSFGQNVIGAGLFLVDLWNPGGLNPVTISAYTGTSLGTFTAAAFNFQPNSLYFMGIVSTNADIRSIVISNPSLAGDIVGYDNIEFAPAAATPAVPEPASLVLLCSGLIGAGVRRWRARRTAV
jgi:hypothetical protein